MKCDCYRPYEELFNGEIGLCMGTKEIDKCRCEGDESKCDFYPNKRKKSHESKPKTLSELVKLLLDNNFKLTIQRGYSFKNCVRITITDIVYDRHVMQTIGGTGGSYSVPDEILIDYIASMIDELKNYQTI